jgi:hypothetical protein
MSWSRIAFAVAMAFPMVAGAQSKTFTVDADFDAGQLFNTSHPPADQLVLGPTPVTKTHIVWACHTASAMVVRLDTVTGKQTGRFDSALQFVNGVPTGAAPEFGANWPRRVSVDNNGDVWIPNAAFGWSQGTLSKFSGDVNHCIDRNHNGKIDTSNDANNDGIINTFDPLEFFGQNDECILTTIPAGLPGNGTLRSIAVDRNGKVWTAQNSCTQPPCKVYRYNPAEPVTLEATIGVNGTPYSMAAGGQYVFIGQSGGGFSTRINIDTLQVEYLNGCPAYYGAVVADPAGKYAIYGNYNGGIVKADYQNMTCTQTASQPVYTVSLDLNLNVWAAHISNAYTVKMSPQQVILGTFATPSSAHGVSTDFQGYVWLSGYNSPIMMKIDPNQNQVIGQYRYDCPNCPNPLGVNYTSYLYSDFTGVQVNRQAPYVYFGNWTGTFDGGTDGIPWQTVSWNQEMQGVVPNLTTLKVFVRAHDNQNLLPTVGYTPAANGGQVSQVVGRYAQVEVDFTGPGYVTPVLSDVTITGPCPNGIGQNCCIKDVDCDDKNACTSDSCPMAGGACAHVKKMNCCNIDADCADQDLCTADKCPVPGGGCTHNKIKGCCNVDGDCNDGNLCTGDKCFGGPGGMCSNAPINGCCNSNTDCDDTNACTIDLCSGAGGTCGHFLKGNCCNKDADCDDKNVCTTDTCSGPGGICKHTAKANCCNSDIDCDDGNDCTDDKCPIKGGLCTHMARANCCKTNSDCDDKDMCTGDACVSGACQHTPIVRCCNANDACNDNDVCTTDTCTGPGGQCQHSRVPGCCSLNSDCDDHDPCTKDVCSGTGGKCSYSDVGLGCCKADSDCDDLNKCTTDRCNGGASCEHDQLANCFCNSDSDCAMDWKCVDHACTPPGGPDAGELGAGKVKQYASAPGVAGGCGVAGGGRGSGVWVMLGLVGMVLLQRRARERYQR